jgi:hypothetical protein
MGFESLKVIKYTVPRTPTYTDALAKSQKQAVLSLVTYRYY